MVTSTFLLSISAVLLMALNAVEANPKKTKGGKACATFLSTA